MQKVILKIIWFTIITSCFLLVISAVVNESHHLATEVKNLQDFNYKQAKVVLNNRTIQVDVAETEEQLTKGLGGRASLLPDQGMLFVYPVSGKLYFWMKDMEFSLDIIWFDENMKVVDWKADATPESFPESFAPKNDARYVLEVPAGFAEKNGLKVGDEMKILQNS